MSKVGNDPQHGSGIKLGRVGGQYQADLEVLHFILQLIDPFFLLGFCEQVTQTAYAFHIIDIGKSGIFDRIEKYDLSFDERSEEHTSELQSLMRISYAVFCLKKKITTTNHTTTKNTPNKSESLTLIRSNITYHRTTP